MLAEVAIGSAKPRAKPYKITDAKGLYIQIKPNGTKAWGYRYEMRVDHKLREGPYALGNYFTPLIGETGEEGKLRRAGGLFTLSEVREERYPLTIIGKGRHHSESWTSSNFKPLTLTPC